MSTTIFNDQGTFHYEDNGQESVQVFDGDGEPDFKFRYKQEIKDTEWFFHLLDQEPKTKMLDVFVSTIDSLKAAIAGGYGQEKKIIEKVQTLRSLVKSLIAPHQVDHDCRVCACCLESAWKLATVWKVEV